MENARRWEIQIGVSYKQANSSRKADDTNTCRMNKYAHKMLRREVESGRK